MFGKRIAELRKKQGLTQSELARSIGISRSALSLYEIEKREPDIETLNKFASLFSVSLDYLLGNSEVSSVPFVIRSEEAEEKRPFYFLDDVISIIFSNRIKMALADIGLTEIDFTEQSPIGREKAYAFLASKGDPNANDLIELSQFLDTSIDYLLGKIPKSSRAEKKMLNAFVRLNDDNQDIIIGKAKELLKEQQYESAAASKPLSRNGTEKMGK